MKKNYLFIGIGLLLIVIALFDFSLKVDNKGHYFVNGILCGIGSSMMVVHFLKLKKLKK